MTCVIFVTFIHVNLNFIRRSYRKKKLIREPIKGGVFWIFHSVALGRHSCRRTWSNSAPGERRPLTPFRFLPAIDPLQKGHSSDWYWASDFGLCSGALVSDDPGVTLERGSGGNVGLWVFADPP